MINENEFKYYVNILFIYEICLILKESIQLFKTHILSF